MRESMNPEEIRLKIQIELDRPENDIDTEVLQALLDDLEIPSVDKKTLKKMHDSIMGKAKLDIRKEKLEKQA